MPRRPAVPLLLLAALSCSTPTDPWVDTTVDQWPYVVSPAGMRVFGTSGVLLILSRFADGLPIPVSSAALQDQFFASGSGQLTATYRLASEGQFTLRGKVTRWYQSGIPSSGLIPGPHNLEDDYVSEAIAAADAELDLGDYDNDGPDGRPNSGDDDGFVDGGVVVLNSELNLYCNNGTGHGPHPHSVSDWRPHGAPLLTGDRRSGGGFIAVGGYVVMSATGCSATGNATPTLAHELGHLLFALPDLYQAFDYSPSQPWAYRRWVLGCWELMAAGSGWGCGSGTPSYDGRLGTFGAWSRLAIGWVAPQIAPPDRDASYDLSALGHGGTLLRIPFRGNESLLLEYREPQPGDQLPPAAGLLVYHLADTLPLFPPTPAGWSQVTLIEADDDDGLRRTELQGGNRGVAGDAFGITRSTLRPGQHSRFTAIDGTPLPFELLEITLSPGTHKARVRLAPLNP